MQEVFNQHVRLLAMMTATKHYTLANLLQVAVCSWVERVVCNCYVINQIVEQEQTADALLEKWYEEWRSNNFLWFYRMVKEDGTYQQAVTELETSIRKATREHFTQLSEALKTNLTL